MARPLRIEYDGAIYHVTARGNERGRIFFAKRDYLKFKEYLAEAKCKFGCMLHAYVLMTNHYHLIIETPEGNLGKIMHHLNGSYTTYLNIKRKRSGHRILLALLTTVGVVALVALPAVMLNAVPSGVGARPAAIKIVS